MKMVKSLLLGSAAGLVAVAGAQAADLPVKAKPVEYVKICTLYGDGFYYIPGSDTCLKLSGYIRADYGWHTANNGTDVANSGASGTMDRNSPNYTTRHRARFEFDARMQTAYGTVRNFEQINVENSTVGGNSASVTRAFIQWAGWTFGRTQSFSDTWDLDAAWRYIPQEISGSTGAAGLNQIAYTWELGNGMSLTAGADEPLRKSLTNLSSASALKIGSSPTSSFEAIQWPDPHVDFKINQAWGRFAVSAKAHDVSATYYTGAGTGPFVGGGCVAGTQPSTTQCAYADSKIGFGAAAGGQLNADFISRGDKIGASVHYSVGHLAFVMGRMTGPGLFESGNQVGFGWVTDGVFVNGSQIELTTAWSAQFGYDHAWTQNLKTSLSGAYAEVTYNGTAANYLRNQMGAVCATGTGAATSSNLSALAGNSCNPNFQYFQGGIRTQWNVTKAFFLGVDVAYNQTFTAFKGAGTIIVPGGQNGARPTGIYNFKDTGETVVTFRALSAW